MDEASPLELEEGVWAEPADFGGNIVTQLLVPAGSGDQAGTADSRARLTVKAVLATYQDALSLHEGGLRPAQRGAVHTVLGYWLTRRTEPATVVMPTGTGKTETMLALLVAAQVPRLLVLVPSKHLRDQIASKFERLGVLQELGIISRDAARPVVGRMTNKITDRVIAARFAEACNVIVATPQVLNLCDQEVREAILTTCSHLFVDEAHHVEARTWSYVRSWFADRLVVQFTATPFREDGRHVAGRLVYSYPLREAQKEGHFSTINYTSVLDFTDPDGALAERATAQLRADLAADHDHLLMARAKSVKRARELAAVYQEIAPDMKPVLLYSQMSSRSQARALDAIRSRESRIIVCVNMLGEGFDLPELKVAAIHDPQKSLSVTMQFIGRFTRSKPNDLRLGPASAFVTHPNSELDTRLRGLYAEDADWNTILHNLSEAAVQVEAEVSEFEAGFTQLPSDIALRNLMPKLSAVVYKSPTDYWNPDALYDYFGAENLLPIQSA